MVLRAKILRIVFLPLALGFVALRPQCRSYGDSALWHVVDPVELRLEEENTRRYIRLVEAWVADSATRGLTPSVAAGVVANGRLVWSTYHRTDETRRYGLASITKTVTGLAIMQLIERGLIDLDDPVRKHLPGVRISRGELHSRDVTIADLLSHTGGLPDLRYYQNPEWKQPPESGVGFALPRQVYPAGSHYRYSNHGFILLGEILKKKTGLSIPEYYRRNIFEPGGMDRAQFTDRHSGAFGLTMTLPDLAAYAALWLRRGESIRGRRLLSESSVDRMLRPPIFFPDGESHAYCGLAWRVEKSGDSIVSFYHIGGADGVMSWVQMFPEHGVAIVYLGNPPAMVDALMSRIPDLQNRLALLATAISGAPAPVNRFRQSVAGASTGNLLPGIYQNPLNGAWLEIERLEDGGLRLRRNGRSWEDLRPHSAREFITRSQLYDFSFYREGEAPAGIATVQEYFLRSSSPEDEEQSLAGDPAAFAN